MDRRSLERAGLLAAAVARPCPRRLLLIAALLLFPCTAAAQAGGTVDLMRADTIARIVADPAEGELPPTLGRLLANRGHYTLIVLRRTATTEVESHDEWDDVMLVRSGAGTVLWGGQLRDARTVAPGEYRGGEIAGGRGRRLVAGDVLVLPAGVPHQVVLEPGEELTYLLIKVQQPPRPAQGH